MEKPGPSGDSTPCPRPAEPGPPCSPSTQTAQQPDFMDASDLSKFLLTRTPKEPAVTANPLPYPHPVGQGTTDGRRSPSAQTAQQPDVSYLSKFLLTTTLKEQSDASYLSKFLLTTTLKEQSDASYLSKFLLTTTLKEQSVIATPSPYPHPVSQGTIEGSPPSRRRMSPGPHILVLKPLFWHLEFYIRTDLSGCFHTYPDLGGPFKSLQEAEDAIDRHLDDLKDPKMRNESLDKLSAMERVIRLSLYWPDGTMKSQSKPLAFDKSHEPKRLMVQAFVDQYNKDHNLSGDLAYELKDVMRYQLFVSENETYIHVNFTAKTKGADECDHGIEDLFFAEGKFLNAKHHQEMVVSCICIVKPNDNGHCCGCKNTRSIDMKHPNEADAYSGGHVDGYLPFGGFHTTQDDFDSLSIETKEKRLRHMFRCFDDPDFVRTMNPIVSHPRE